MLLLALVVESGVVRAQGGALESLAEPLDVGAAGLSVSGVSSGGYMAQQFHIVHSRHVTGAGIVAAGPYRCAAGSYAPWSWFDWTGLYAATSVCSDANPYWFYAGPPDVEHSLRETRRAVRDGAIDEPRFLRGDRVWLLSGGADETVPHGVVDALERYYLELVDASDLRHEKLGDAGHAMITDDFGNRCGASAPPYVNDCDFDAAGKLLEHLLGPLRARVPRARVRDVVEFDQSAFFDTDDPSASLHPSGHLYVPASCAAGARCRLHVAFHGCRQSQDVVGDAFYAESGYNEWAEANDIVVLYPQATAWDGGVAGGALRNPRGCWDWWGYGGDRYHTRDGTQIRAVAAMVDVLVGAELLGGATPRR